MTNDDLHSELFERTLRFMVEVLAVLLDKVPPPKKEPIGNGYVFRFAEKSLQQAIVQKLARIISAMRASELLLNAGFVQELGGLHRQIDETCDDVVFLALGSREVTLPIRHCDFLHAFYAEEIVDGQLTGKPDIGKAEVPRKKISAYIAENSGKGINKSSMIEHGKYLHRAYSGYIHGSSPTIMELYGGQPARFHVNGMDGTSIQEGHSSSMFHYYYRSFMTFIPRVI
jgi:hypothetical protein